MGWKFQYHATRNSNWEVKQLEKLSFTQKYLIILAAVMVGSAVQVTHTISPVDDRTWMYGMIGIVSIVMFILAIIDRQGIDRALTYFIVNIIVCGAVIFAGFFIGTPPIFLIFITWKSISSDTNSFPRCQDYTFSYSHAPLHF